MPVSGRFARDFDNLRQIFVAFCNALLNCLGIGILSVYIHTSNVRIIDMEDTMGIFDELFVRISLVLVGLFVVLLPLFA